MAMVCNYKLSCRLLIPMIGIESCVTSYSVPDNLGGDLRLHLPVHRWPQYILNQPGRPLIRPSSHTMAGPPVRERYNAKARGSTAGGGHKKRKRPKIKEVNEDGTPVDSPAAPPVEVEAEGDGRGKMSSKKRKRMDSYIVSHHFSSCN